MRLWTLALVFVATVSYCGANTVQELKVLADRAGAPFTTVALERMDNIQLWGAKRAARSADVVIINKSGISFKLLKAECAHGSSSSGLLAESNLGGQTSTVLGYQSSDEDSYAYINCDLTFAEGRVEDPKAFRIDIYPKNVNGDVTGTGDRYTDGIEIVKVDDSIDTDNKNYQLVFEVQSSNDVEKRGAPVR